MLVWTVSQVQAHSRRLRHALRDQSGIRVIVGQPGVVVRRWHSCRQRPAGPPGASRRRTCGGTARRARSARAVPPAATRPARRVPWRAPPTRRRTAPRALRASYRSATAAFQRRAPSSSVATPCSRAAAQIAVDLRLRARRCRRRDCGCSRRPRAWSAGTACARAACARRGTARPRTTRLADLGELHPGVHRARARLVPHQVALPTHDHIVAGPGQQSQRDLVGHGAGRQPERSLLAEQCRALLLQRVDRRILAELVVADRRRRDHRAHRRRRPRDGVGAEIDHRNGGEQERGSEAGRAGEEERGQARKQEGGDSATE